VVEEFDYIIVGAGTAGSVLAHRLTENPEVRVLVLEAGGNRIPANVDVAPLWYTLLGSPVDWGYSSVPQPGLGGRSTYEPRGKIPGGSSNLNIMMHVRGHPSDFDAWAYQGAAGWSYADLLPYFRRMEDQEDAADAADAIAGTGGPQVVTNAGAHDPNPLSRTFIEACLELGHSRTPDFNGSRMIGAGWHHLNVKDGKRMGALASYLEPALHRPNLTVRTGARAMSLEVVDGRCTGVTYRQQDVADVDEGRTLAGTQPAEPGEWTVRARAEVLLCAGAIESPKLLMLSGIGAPDQLRPLGIEVVAPLPGVGANFHNHVLVGLIAETVEPVEPGRQNLSESALFATSEPGLPAPDLQLAFVHVPFDVIVGQRYPNAVSILPGVVRPHSRGSVKLAGPDPFDHPLVDPNYLSDRSDVERLVHAVRLSRDIFAASAFKSALKGELMPGPDVRTDQQLEQFVRERADSYHHQAGSCRMGIDDLAVVDPRLRVHGVAGLRVVDASVMPAVPSGNCNTAIAAIAERAADLIKGDA
jgi:choline dehydrogenase